MASATDYDPIVMADPPSDLGHTYEAEHASQKKSRSLRADVDHRYEETHNAGSTTNSTAYHDHPPYTSPTPSTNYLEQSSRRTTQRGSPPQLRQKQRVQAVASAVSPSPGNTRASSHQRDGTPLGAPNAELSRSSKTKKRKSSGFRTVIRKIFGRSSVKSQISLPTPTKQLSSVPGAFITTVTDNRYQRAASLPAQEISRTSALGSHSPFVPPPPFTEEARETPATNHLERPPRPRRATLPSVIINSPVMDTDSTFPHLTGSQQDGQNIDEESIGFAITSGSNPKRRSRSADALFDAAKSHRMSPIQWRRWRRRSDEIKYWRDSIGAVAPMAASPDLPKVIPPQDQAPMGFVAETTHDTEEHEVTDERDTFDFGLLASAMQSQEKISVEERVVTLEVKLMDLEYAISKLQARTPSPAERYPSHLSPAQRSRDDSTASGHRDHETVIEERSPSAAPSARIHQHERPSTGSDSHEFATSDSPSTGLTSHYSQPEEVIEPKPRPTSNATTLRAHPISQLPPSPRKAPNPTRNSLTRLTIDHYTTLISLIRREQSARIRLEEQVSDLQRQVMNLRSPSPAQSRGRPWKDYSYHHSEPRSARSARDFDDSDADDGFQDVYETPTERIEFEGRSFEGSPLGGEAF